MSLTIKSRGITSYWWVPLLTGLICIALGIWTICCPAESIPVLAYAFAICLLLAGCFNVGFAIAASGFPKWGWTLATGILELIAGGWMFFMPVAEMSAVFIFVAGIWLMCVAVNGMCEAIVMSSYSRSWLVWMILDLIAVIILAVVFLSQPLVGAVTVWLWLGISLICFGIFRLMLSATIRRINRLTSF